MKQTLFSLLLLSPLLIGGSSCHPKSSSGHVRISGAFALYPLTVKWSEEYQKAHSGLKFDISAGGAGKGLTDVLAGADDIGMFSRELTPAEKHKGVWVLAVARDAVLPTINANNPLIASIMKKGLTRQQFKKIFLDGRQLTWGEILDTANRTPVHVYTRSDAAGAAETWAQYLGGRQEDIKGVGIFGDPGLADAVIKDPDGIGFNNTTFVYDINTGKKRAGLEIVPIDLNGNGIIDSNEHFYGSFDEVLHAIAVGKYPSPPARQLYFIAKGRPADPQVVAFLKWVLTNGQTYVKAAGYVPLEGQALNASLKELNAP